MYVVKKLATFHSSASKLDGNSLPKVGLIFPGILERLEKLPESIQNTLRLIFTGERKTGKLPWKYPEYTGRH